MSRIAQTLSYVLLVSLGYGCETTPPAGENTAPTVWTKGSSGKVDASVEAIFVDFEFDGVVEYGNCFDPEKRVEEQLLYTMGQLNGDRGVGRLDNLELSNVVAEPTENGCRVTYSARMLVGWGYEHEGRTSYELILPRDVRHKAIEDLFEHHGKSCAKTGSEPDSGSLWYYWRPSKGVCTLSDEIAVRIPVTISPSPVHTSGMYPEYHKVWEDGSLKVVTIFGKVEAGGDDSDTGVKGYNAYIKKLKSLSKDWDLKTLPEDLPENPGNAIPDVTLRATLPDGRVLEVVALLIDSVKSADYAFYQRYQELTKTVDLLTYNGHSGLGANIRTLARKGEWTQGQYSIVFMNGCDTYAYVDSALADAHAEVNPDDPEGTKYLDVLMNAMPSYFYTMADSGMTLIKALLNIENPKTYEQIFVSIDKKEMVIVSGEHDNEYVPGFGSLESTEVEIVGGEVPWEGMMKEGTVGKSEEVFFQTPALAPGTYRFEMSGDGDADLYVRMGESPSLDLFDCRPFSSGSVESCEVEINVATPLYAMVRGWHGDSNFELVATQVD